MYSIRTTCLSLSSALLALCGTAWGDETLFAHYFDIKTGSSAGTEVTGKVNLLRNKDVFTTPVPSDFSFAITSDPSGMFELVNERDSKTRLFGALRVKPGQAIPATPTNYPVTVQLSQGGTVLATTTLTVRSLSQTLHEQMLAYAIPHCRTYDRLFARVRPTDAQVLDWITQVETNNGRFIDSNPATPLDFYTRPVSDYQNTVNNTNNLSSQWQEVGAILGGMGFAYTNTDTRYSTTYGPNGTPAHRQRLKEALMLAFATFIDRIPLDPDQALFNGQRLSNDFGDGVFRLNEKGVATHTDVSHQWIWTDPVTGPAVWLMPDIIAGIKTGDATCIALHEKLMHFFQIGFGAVGGSYRNLRGNPHVWSGMAPEQVGYTDGAFSDGNLDHRFRNWLTLPAIWIDYNRPITYLPYWYDGYTWPNITPTLVTGSETYRFKPGFVPKGVLEDFAWWVNHYFPDTHFYISEGANPDGSFSHHLRGNLNDITMVAYGSSAFSAIPGMRMLRDFPNITLDNEAYNRMADLWLATYDKMIYKSDFEFTAAGVEYLTDLKRYVSGIPNSADQLIAARQPGTQINQLASLQSWSTAVRNGTHAVTGDFSFWVNNLHIHRKGGTNTSNDSYYFAVKMGSDRTGTSDDPAGKPFHMGSGTFQTKVTGTEYDLDVRKRFDWHTLSGITEEWRTDAIPLGEITSQVAGSPYAGTATDGVCGLSAMRYRPAAASTYATANADKAWFFPSDMGVALGSGIARRANMTGQGMPIITTVDQCRWQGDLTYAVNGGAPVTVANTTNLSQDITLNAPSWLHQGSVGYLIFPQGDQPLSLRGGASVVDSHADDTSTTTLLHIALGHGVDPATSGLTKYFYICVPNKTAAEMPALLATAQSQIEVVSNGNNVQGIYHTGLELAQLAFHTAGTITLANGMEVTVDRPALVQLRKNGANWEVAATSPIHDFTATAINLTVKAPLKSGSFAHTYPGVIPRAGENITVTQSPGGVARIRVPLPDVTDGPDLDYQEQLYANVPIRVTIPVNTPTSATSDNATTEEDLAKTIDVLANDGNGLTIGELTQGDHGTTAIVGGKVVYTPNANWNGTDSFTYSAFDANGNAAAATVTVTVTAVDDPPVFSSNPVVKPAATLGIAYSDTLAGLGSDPDEGDTFTFTRINGPAWLTVAADGTLSGTPTGNPGTSQWLVRITDAEGAFTEAALHIVVQDGDTDGDGLLNSAELAAGTNPQMVDTDGDGYSDSYEVNHNTDPNSPGNTPQSLASALWDFNDTSVAGITRDLIGAVPGTLMGGATLGADGSGLTGMPGDRALILDGANKRVDVSDVAFLRNAATDNDLTVSFWQKLDQLPTGETNVFWAFSPTASGNRGMQAHVPYSNGTVYFDCANASGGRVQASGLSTTWTGWRHVALVRRVTGTVRSAEIWVDGVRVANSTNRDALLTDYSALTIGSRVAGAGSIRGSLDDFTVYRSALNQTEIQALAAGGMPDQFPSPKQAWKQQQFGTDASNPAIAGDEADPDGDTRTNLMEWALGSNPKASGSSDFTQTTTKVDNTDYLRLTVQKNPAATDVFYQGEVTSDVSQPASWSKVDVMVESNTPNTLIVRDKIGGPKRFIRIRTTTTP